MTRSSTSNSPIVNASKYVHISGVGANFHAVSSPSSPCGSLRTCDVFDSTEPLTSVAQHYRKYVHVCASARVRGLVRGCVSGCMHAWPGCVVGAWVSDWCGCEQARVCVSACVCTYLTILHTPLPVNELFAITSNSKIAFAFG